MHYIINMENIDLDYISKSISSVSGLPLRIFKGEKLIKTYSIIPFPIDPFCA